MYWNPHYIKENAEELQGISKFVQGLTSSQGVRIPLQFTPHTVPHTRAHSNQTPTRTNSARWKAHFYE